MVKILMRRLTLSAKISSANCRFLFQQMSAPQVALVLAYLPPEWASRVLGELTPADQTAIMGELSQAREVPPEIVKDIEAQVKGKLPYLVGVSIGFNPSIN